ncbi:NAD(P)/FAD-dependent oxidoreductase [Thorsellia anophelis]|uniref:Predicted NAD/FAD-binding protein n=1 Tax=Thorsellia anophelis DSM 18579 TaxID=1123402 RepID=A0A1H9YPY8_9GAMM|nr:FAD-dependent oxidoreductase [Thorsellia anophelis]SES71160.1 Predicted NAD/FAD-binding protein [Thorsellia anophelis DSM 18579]
MTRKKIAIIGSGISGLGAAYLLNPHHDITLFEKNNTLGGHSRTIELDTSKGKVPVDTGFIVFNYRNYPHLTALFEHLSVPIAKSDMSFGVSIDDGRIEYGTRKLPYIFAQKRNLLRPAFYKMLRDILKFNKMALEFVALNPNASMQQCLEELKLGDWFKNYYLLAMGGAIWSTPLDEMLRFPAKTMIQFFDNHGLLTVNNQPQWYTVKGGSREYVNRISDSFKSSIRSSTPIKSVIRTDQGVEVKTASDTVELFDEVIFACHSDQSLALLCNPSESEKQILGNVHYQPNTVYVHNDLSFMPKRKQAWSSWVYLSGGRQSGTDELCLTYWMNNLQPITSDSPILVTLNPKNPPDRSKIFDKHDFEHPKFDQSAINAQNRIEEIQGIDKIWYAGAWLRYGFHEDGLLSAVKVAEKMGISPPWLQK